MFLIIDGNNVAWAGYYALERAMKPDSDERRHRVALLGLASMALGAIARGGEPPPGTGRTPPSRVALCFDEGRPIGKREIHPPYQMGREADPKFVGNEPTVLGAIHEFSEMAAATLPIEIVRGVNVEADELIAGLALAEPETPKRIISNDRDFLQLISPTTSVYAPVTKVVIDDANFGERAFPKMPSGSPVAFPRERYVDYRALSGDPSDSLTGVPGVGALSAAKLVAAAPLDAYFGDAAAVRAALGRRSEAVERAFADGTAREIVERNRVLMDLRRPAPCWAQLDELTRRGPWDRPAFESWLDDQKITTVDRGMLMEAMEGLAAADKLTG